MDKKPILKKIVILLMLLAYYFAVGKYMLDLYTFFNHYEVGVRPMLESRTWEGCNLFPWPLENLPKPRDSELIGWFSRPLTLPEIFVRDCCYKIPIVTVSFIILPMVPIHIYYYEKRLLPKRLMLSSIIFFGIGTTILILSSLNMQFTSTRGDEREWMRIQYTAYQIPLAIIFLVAGGVMYALVFFLKFRSWKPRIRSIHSL